MTWAVGLIVPSKEFMCNIDMERMGIPSYLPLGTRLTKPKRKRKPIKTTFFPFPGYIFIQDVRNYHKEMKFVRGFRRVLFDSISDEIVGDVLKKQNEGAFDLNHFKNNKLYLFEGEEVLITVGPLLGLLGLVQRNTRGSSWVLLDVMGMQVKILVDFVEKIREKQNPLLG